ncbi:MAG: ATP-binding protein [Candidatus Bathyarchaeota archaeon]|nr:ATP-binding protein [Candidatus Bathyarchaeota archaeon]
MYNPFDEKIENLKLQDIKALREKQVTEGFYIEYKSTFTTTLKIARSIASFANTHGGWYFIGIESDQSNLPTTFPGFDLKEHPKPLEHIRDIIKDNIDPFPIYYSKLIEVETGKAIVVLEIPESDEPPHITKDGRIYRRNSAGSDPVAENNRYVIDGLYEKANNIDKKIERFCCRQIAISRGEEKNSWMEVYLMPYPLNRMEIDSFFKTKFIDDLKVKMNGVTKIEFSANAHLSASIPFNCTSASYSSVIFRQANTGGLAHMGLTFELYRNGNAKIIIPYQSIPSGNTQSKSPAWEKMISCLKDEDIRLFTIIDGFKALSIFVCLLQHYIDIIKSQNWKGKILLAYRLENTWRTILFFNSNNMIEHIEKYGVSVCQKDNAWIPTRLRKEYMIEEIPENCIFWLSQFMIISSHFGFFPGEGRAFVKEWITSFSKNGDDTP